MSLKEILDWLKEYNAAITALAAVLGVVITAIYTFVTYRLVRISNQQREILAAQHKLQSSQVKYMLYEQRLKIFRKVLCFVEEMNTNQGVKTGESLRLRIDTEESVYIFGNDIQDYINEIVSNSEKYNHAVDQCNKKFDNLPDRRACEEEIRRLGSWLMSQYHGEIVKRFSPYLTIEE